MDMKSNVVAMLDTAWLRAYRHRGWEDVRFWMEVSKRVRRRRVPCTDLRRVVCVCHEVEAEWTKRLRR